MDDERKAELIAAYPTLKRFEGDSCWMSVALEIADTVRPGPQVVAMLEELAATRGVLAGVRKHEEATTVYVTTPDNRMFAYSRDGGWQEVFVLGAGVPVVEAPWRRRGDGTLAHPAAIPAALHPRDIEWVTSRTNMHDPDNMVVRRWTPATLAREAYRWGRADQQALLAGKRLLFQGDNLHVGGVTLEALRDMQARGSVLADEADPGLVNP